MENDQITNDQALLRTCVFGGFEKKQVLAYIDLLREQNQNSVAELETHMAELSTARKELSDQIDGFERQIGDLEQQLEQRGGQIQELTGMIDSLKDEMEQQRLSQEDADRVLAAQKEQNRQLSLRAHSFEYKAQRYDDVAEQLGDVLLAAQQNAREVINAADRQAEQIKTEAINATEQATGEMRALRGDLAKIRESIESMIHAFTNRLDGVDAVICAMEHRGDKASFVPTDVPELTAAICTQPSVEPEEKAADQSEKRVEPELAFDDGIEVRVPLRPELSFFRSAAQA